MARKTPIRFAVMPEHEADAVAYVRERGYEPAKVEQDDHGFVYLIFSPLPDAECWKLVEALPIHLSAKVGFVMQGPPPFVSPDGKLN